MKTSRSHHAEGNAQKPLAHLRAQLEALRPVGRWLVGFSGGLDSTALLAALVASEPAEPVIALHVNHGLSPRAAEWQEHCQRLCAELGVEFRARRAAVAAVGRGLEAAARDQRYRVFEAEISAGDVLLLGHHRHDQAETLLFRLMRGTGPRGLAAIVRQRPLATGLLLRPFLQLSRAELQAFVRERGLAWIEDESNQDDSFDRNFLRRRVLPHLRQRWPDFERRWQATAEACAEAEQLSEDLAELDLQGCGAEATLGGERLRWQALHTLAPYRRNNLLRHWARRQGRDLPERRALLEIEQQLWRSGEPPAGARLRWGDTLLAVYRDWLYLMPARMAGAAPDRSRSLDWQLDRELQLPDGSQLRTERGPGGLRPDIGCVELRWRRGGERCRPAGRQHSQTLKKLLQEAELEPWWRDRVPILYVEGRLAAVGDLWVCADFASPDPQARRIDWRRSCSDPVQGLGATR